MFEQLQFQLTKIMFILSGKWKMAADALATGFFNRAT